MTGRASRVDKAIGVLKAKRAGIEEKADRECAALSLAIHELEAQQTTKPAKVRKLRDAKGAAGSESA